jgi:hypothetical protein
VQTPSEIKIKKSNFPKIENRQNQKSKIAEIKNAKFLNSGNKKKLSHVERLQNVGDLVRWRDFEQELAKQIFSHTGVDYARVLKDLADIHFAHAKTIVLVQDNLSIHSKASL